MAPREDPQRRLVAACDQNLAKRQVGVQEHPLGCADGLPDAQRDTLARRDLRGERLATGHQRPSIVAFRPPERPRLGQHISHAVGLPEGDLQGCQPAEALACDDDTGRVRVKGRRPAELEGHLLGGPRQDVLGDESREGVVQTQRRHALGSFAAHRQECHERGKHAVRNEGIEDIGDGNRLRPDLSVKQHQCRQLPAWVIIECRRWWSVKKDVPFLAEVRRRHRVPLDAPSRQTLGSGPIPAAARGPRQGEHAPRPRPSSSDQSGVQRVRLASVEHPAPGGSVSPGVVGQRGAGVEPVRRTVVSAQTVGARQDIGAPDSLEAGEAQVLPVPIRHRVHDDQDIRLVDRDPVPADHPIGYVDYRHAVPADHLIRLVDHRHVKSVDHLRLADRGIPGAVEERHGDVVAGALDRLNDRGAHRGGLCPELLQEATHGLPVQRRLADRLAKCGQPRADGEGGRDRPRVHHPTLPTR